MREVFIKFKVYLIKLCFENQEMFATSAAIPMRYRKMDP